MNFIKQKCITAAVLLLVAILSITVVGKYVSAPENHQKTIASLDEKKQTVMELTAASTVTSALITLLPGDTATPIAEKMADVSGYLLVVLCAIYLEKYLVTITGYVAFTYLIPIACGLWMLNLIFANATVRKLAAKLAVDYGWPLGIPEALAARNKGSSALAVALRTLAGIKPAGSPLIQEAATQANAQAAP